MAYPFMPLTNQMLQKLSVLAKDPSSSGKITVIEHQLKTKHLKRSPERIQSIPAKIRQYPRT